MSNDKGITHPRYWTKSEVKILVTFYDNVPIQELNQMLPRKSSIAIRNKASMLNICKNPQPKCLVGSRSKAKENQPPQGAAGFATKHGFAHVEQHAGGRVITHKMR